jgi:TonB family protein
MPSFPCRALVVTASGLWLGVAACTPAGAPQESSAARSRRPIVALRPLIQAGEPRIEGGKLDEKAITSRVELDEAPLRACYMDGLRRNEKLAGRIVLNFDINVAGEVESCTVALSQLRDDAVDACVRDVAAKWKFPGSVEGTLRQVSLPLTLVTRIEKVIET